MEHSNQHWIPRSYLETWCDPDTPKGYTPFVWRFSKDGSTTHKKAPRNIFCETDMYTINLEDGSRNLSLERGFLRGLESAFAKLRKTKLVDHAPLTSEDKLVLCVFIAAMRARTQVQRNHWQSQWGNILEFADAISSAITKMEPEKQREFAQTLWTPSSHGRSFISHEEVQKLAGSPLQHMLIPVIQAQIIQLMPMTLSILTIESEPGFITSDAPCVWFDAEAHKRPFPYNTPTTASETIQITMPLSPWQMALFSWNRRLRAYIPLWDDEIIDDLNRQTRFHCNEYFIVRQNATKPIWFDLGQPSGTPP